MLRNLFKRKSFQYECHECGVVHVGTPSFGLRFPAHYFDVPENERDARVTVNGDLCKIEPNQADFDGDTIYFIRTILEIPIKGSNEPICWGVWVTQSKESFEEYTETYDTDQTGRRSFGWLVVDLPYYNGSDCNAPLAYLECDVQWGGPGQRPEIHLWAHEHQLSVDQHNGISWRKAAKIANLASSLACCPRH